MTSNWDGVFQEDCILVDAHPDIQALFWMCVAFLRANGCKIPIYITSVKRSTGVHSTGRAIDFAFDHDAMMVPENIQHLLRLRAMINLLFPYTKGDGVPSYTCIYRQKTAGNSGDTEHRYHVHLQMPGSGWSV